MRNIRLTMLIFVCTISVVCKAQERGVVNFSYDANGNRTSYSWSAKKIEENGRSVDDTVSSFNQTHNIAFSKANLSIYPNPTDGKFCIALNDCDNNSIHAILFNASGVVIKECDLSADTNNEFDLSGEPGGIYFLRLLNGKESQTWKIIKL